MKPQQPQTAVPMPKVQRRFLELARSLSLHDPVVCDVGSRDASEGITLFQTLGARELHLFEPNPAAAAKCRRNLAAQLNRKELSAVTVNQIAVSEKDGTAPFYAVDVERSENKDIGFSSLFRINPAYTKRRGSIVQKEITVETVRLDTYFEGRPPPDLLWIDVEGAELLVLHGARSVLKRVALLHVEVSFRHMQLGKPLFWEIDSYLRKVGMRFAFFPEISPLKSFLYRRRLLPNSPWRVDAVYYRDRGGLTRFLM